MTLLATPAHGSAVARLGAALADDTRARILLELRAAPATPGDLAAALGVSKQVMSNQLACLRGCGLVTSEKDGRRAWYRLADDGLGPALDALLRLTTALDPACCTPDGCACR